jgi:hypothetical protein
MSSPQNRRAFHAASKRRLLVKRKIADFH